MIFDLKKLKKVFQAQKDGAGSRGIAFIMSFDDWLSIWIKSGKLHLRGNGRGKYCMARFNDMGPYAVGNVKIILQGDNTKEAHVGKQLSPYTKQLLRSANLGKKVDAETKAKMSIRSKGNQHRRGIPHDADSKAKMKVAAQARDNAHFRGRKHSEETKTRMADAQRRRFARERENLVELKN